LRVVDVDKKDDHIVHVVDNPQNVEITEGTKVRAIVDKDRRFAIMKNHTATHIVHEALRRVLGSHVHQQGSLVAPDRLRFDFPHFGKITPEELRAIEEMVNEKIREDIEVRTEVLPIEKARKIPNVKMFFGEKYGESVRVVEIDPKFSVELCGGTHVQNTKEIGFFRFRSEGSVASGTRRIEAVTAGQALELLKLRDKEFGERFDYAFSQLEEAARLLSEAADSSTTRKKELKTIEQSLVRLKRSKTPLPASYPAFHDTFRMQDDNRRMLEDAVLHLLDLRRNLDKEVSRLRVKSLSSNIEELIGKGITIDGLKLVTAQVSAGSMEELQSLGDTVRTKLGSGVGVLASVNDEKVALVCVVTDDLVAAGKLQAGKIVGAVAKLVGGGGGGRAHMATAGGKDATRLPEALRSVESIIRTFLH